MTIIGHLSDTHLAWGADGMLKDRVAHDRFESAIQALKDIAPQLLVHTGDFLDLPSLGGYRNGLALLHDAFDCPVFVVAGNHDSRSLLSAASGGVDMGAPRLIDGVLVGQIDTCKPDQVAGHLTHDSVHAFVEAVDRSDARASVLAIHHSPISGCHHEYCAVEGGDAAVELLAGAAKPIVVLSGHAHTLSARRMGSALIVQAPSTRSTVVHFLNAMDQWVHGVAPSFGGVCQVIVDRSGESSVRHLVVGNDRTSVDWTLVVPD